MSLFDWIGNVAGSIFGGGGGGGGGGTGGGGQWGDFLSGAYDDVFDSPSGGSGIDWGSLIPGSNPGGTNFDWGSLFSAGGGGGGGGAGGGIDWGSLMNSGGGIDWGKIANGAGNFDWNSLAGGGTPLPVQSIDWASNPTNGATPLPGANFGTALNPFMQNPLSLIPGQGGPASTGAPQTPQNPSGVNSSNPLAGTTPPGGAAGGAGGFDWSGLLKGLTEAGLLGAGTGLLGGGNGLPPQAGDLSSMAKNNQDLVNNSILPTALANQQGMINAPALNAIERKLRQSEAGMRQKYAEMGESGSTMEQEDLADLRAKSQDQVFATGQEMAVTGLQTAAQMTGQDASIYQALMSAQIQKDEELGKVLAEFAAASAK